MNHFSNCFQKNIDKKFSIKFIFLFIVDMPPKKSSVVLLYGYFIYYDDYNRAKLMFLDDYDSDDISDKQKFTKLFITRKSKSRGYAPISDDQKHFYIKCKKDSVGLNGLNDSPKLVPIKELIQHKVECIAKVNEYKFYTDGELKQGWNLQLKNIKLLEY